FSSRRRHTRLVSDWSSDVCSSDLGVDGVRWPPGRRECRPSPIVAGTQCCQDGRMARALWFAVLVAGLGLGVISLAVAKGGAGNSFGGGSAFAGAAELAAGYALLAGGVAAWVRPPQARVA